MTSRPRRNITSGTSWEAPGPAGKVFGDIRPANTLVQVAGLVDGPLVEIEADAFVQD